jgi:hypothetical protein
MTKRIDPENRVEPVHSFPVLSGIIEGNGRPEFFFGPLRVLNPHLGQGGEQWDDCANEKNYETHHGSS